MPASRHFLAPTRRRRSLPRRRLTPRSWRPSLESLEPRRQLAAGDLDLAFGADGIVRVNLAGDDMPHAIARQDDGQYVVAGRTTPGAEILDDIGLMRISSDGVLDATFGDAGIVITDVGDPKFGEAEAVLVQPDGKIVTAGAGGVNGSISDSTWRLARYDASGRLDPTFGGDGLVESDFGAYYEGCFAVALQPDGKLLVAGYASSSHGFDYFVVARYNADGSLDDGSPSDSTPDDRFGEAGHVDVQMSVNDVAWTLALQPDGKIVAAGSSGDGQFQMTNVALLRLNPDGSRDASFGVAGIAVQDLGGSAETIASLRLLPDGTLLVGGSTNAPGDRRFFVAKFTSSGTLDASFSGDGVSVLPFSTPIYGLTTMSQDAAGRIVASGIATNAVTSAQEVLLLRMNADGSLDDGSSADADSSDHFGASGFVVTPFLPADHLSSELLVQADQKIVLTGALADGARYDFGVARYESAGCSTLLVDDFDDAVLDASKWTVNTTYGQITETNGRVELVNRGYLVTRDQFDPATGALHISGRFTFVDASWPDHDFLQVLTRSDAVPVGSYGETRNGIEFQANGNDALIISTHVNGEFVPLASTPLRIEDGDVFDFSILDDGLQLSLTLVEVGGQGDSATVTATSPLQFPVNHVVFHNREANNGNSHEIAYLDDVRIVAGCAAPSAPPTDATLIAVPTTVDEGSEVQFFATFVDPNDHEAHHVVVDWGDGSPVEAFAPPVGSRSLTFVHVYVDDGASDPAPGTYAARMSIRDSDGGIARAAVSIEVRNVAPTAPSADFDQLDASFSADGRVAVDFFGGADVAQAIAVQPDGGILVAGYVRHGSNTDLGLSRLLESGELDLSFGVGGRVTFDGFGFEDAALALAVQPDGRILVGGFVNRSTTDSAFALLAFLANGSLDPSFGVGGTVLTEFGASFDYAVELHVNADGTIVVMGAYSDPRCCGSDFALARYRPDGSLDPSFGAAGVTTVSFSGDAEYPRGATVQPDDKIVVVGCVDFLSAAILRVDANGAPDASFGSNGRVTIPTGGRCDPLESVVVLPDGKLLAGGYSGGSMLLVRTLPDGRLDPAYGVGGIVRAHVGGGGNEIQRLILASDGAVLAFGSDGADFVIARFRTDGTLDPSFGVAGAFFVDFGGTADYAYAAAVDPQGRVVVAGANVHDMLVARLGAVARFLQLDAPVVDEGNVITLSGQFVDPGLADTHEVLVDWGDGSATSVIPLAPGARSFAHIVHRYADGAAPASEFTIQVTVRDDDGGQVSGEQVVQVRNVAPSFELGLDATLAPADAGRLARPNIPFVDPGDDAWTGVVDYGDGHVEPLVISAAERTFALDHVYSSDGTFVVRVTLHDGAATTSDSFTAFVTLNSPPLAVDDQADVSEDASRVAIDVLANDLDADGNLVPARTSLVAQPSRGHVVDQGDGVFAYFPDQAFEFLAVGETAVESFTYRIEDTYGATSFATVTLAVQGRNDAPIWSSLLVDHDSPAAPARPGRTVTIRGVLADIDVSDRHAVTVRWGDGSPDAAFFAAEDDPSAAARFLASHAFAQGGVYTITVTVDDQHGGRIVAEKSVFVTGRRLIDGVLQIVGADCDDQIRLEQVGSSNNGFLQVEFHSSHCSADDHYEEQDCDDGQEDDHEGDHEEDESEEHDGGREKRTARYRLRDVTRVEIYGGDGDDLVDLSDVLVPARIEGADGDDELRGGAGDDLIFGGAGDDRAYGGTGNDGLFGGAGDDRLEGDAGDDRLMGDDGDDHLRGGTGRDLLIGGRGADRLEGQSQDDLLIAGWTAYDANDAALSAVANEWRRDVGYATRVANLSSGALGYWLVGDRGSRQTVFDDQSVDRLFGGQGQDWILSNRAADFGGPLDLVSDRAANEVWDDLDS